jgi:PAS domain S-box-containing protein
MLESIGDGCLSCDADWRIVYMSSPAERILQIRREDVLGKNFWEAAPGSEGTLLESEFRRAAAGETRDFEYCYEPWNRWFHNRCFPRQGGGISIYFEDITDRKQAEQAMRESEERFRMSLSGGAVTVYEQDRDLRYLWIHPTDGFAGQMIGKTDLEISGDRDAQLHTDLKLYVLETGKSVKREVAAQFSGRKRWYDLLVEPRLDANGDVVGVVGTALDISERRQAEQALMESEERFRGTFDNAAVGIAHVNLDGRWLTVNDKFCEIVGYSREELLSLSFQQITHPDDLEQDLENASQLVAGDADNYSMEKRYLKKDGSAVWVNLTASINRDPRGEPRYFIAVIEDISARKRAEAKIEIANHRFRVAEEAVKGFNYDWDLETGKISRSLGVERVTGYKREEIPMTWQGWVDLIHPEDRVAQTEEEAIELINRVEGDNAGSEYRLHHKDGYYIWVLERDVFIRGTDGRIIRVIGETVDITERKESEEKLLEAERRAARDYQRLLERISPLAQTIGTSRNLNTIYRALIDFIRLEMPCNDFLVSFYDVEQKLKRVKYVWHNGQEMDVETIQPTSLFSVDALSERAASSGRTIVSQRDAGRTVDDKFRAADKDASVPVHSIVTPMMVMGKVIGTLEVQNRRAQYRSDHTVALEMAASLAAVAIENIRLMDAETQARTFAEEANRSKDEFLAVLSHELRTPLHAMKGWISLLKKGALGELKQAHAIEVIARSVNAQNALIEDILDVSRIISGKLVLEAEHVSLISIVANAVEDARPAAESRGLKLSSELSSDADDMDGDALRLHQIVNNLLNNAIKFTSHGEVKVRLTRSGDSAFLSITDTGIGIDADVLPHIFDRFKQADSSSKRRHGGLGLGLAIVDHLVSLHGGRISADSERGKGSKFTVELPLTARRGEAEPDLLSDETDVDLVCQRFAGQHLLIVEDDPDSLEMLRMTLERGGANVTGVTSTSEAIEALDSGSYDLLISDLGMPEMDGYDLINFVRNELRRGPETLPAVALSGYASADDRERSLASGFQLHLAKPLEMTTLLAELVSLLPDSGVAGSSGN